MSLVEPTIWDTLKPYKFWLICGALALTLIFVATGFYSCGSDYFFKRDIEKKKEAVNTALSEANAVAANINAEKEAANKIAQNVNLAVQDYLGAINATDATRSNVNAAVERMQKAANSNVGNVNAQDVENAMKGL